MPLRAAQILLRTPAGEPAFELVERALHRQRLPGGGARRLLALECEQWLCLLEEGRADGGLARLLSESVAGEVLALELDSARFFLRLRRFAAGEPGAIAQEPAQVAGRLPRFTDVEQRAWDELRALGVPAALRLCALAEVGLLEGEEDGLAAAVLEAGPAGVVRRGARALPPERREGPYPPARPDSLVQSAAGEARALEVRDPGPLPPDEAAAAALAGVEERQALRLCLQLGAEVDEPRLPRPAFAYRGAHPALAALLERARSARPWLHRLLDPGRPAPLSHDGYAAAARALLARACPEAPVLRQHGLCLELGRAGAPGRTVRLGLSRGWEAALRGEEPEPDPDGREAASRLVAEARALLSLPATPVSSWPADAVARGLLPTLGTASQAGSGASAPFAGPLHLALLCDDGDQLAPVDEATLLAAGLGWDAALARAVENADALTLQSPHGLLWFELEHGRVAITDFDDPAGAGRLASPFFRALLLRLLGGFCYAAAPTRDTLLACAPAEPEAVGWLREEAARRHREGPFPLDPAVFDVAEDGVAEVLPDPPGVLPGS